MSFELSTSDYLKYFEAVTERIFKDKDYITSLDAATGDGDHWANLNKGFQAVMSAKESLVELNFGDLFKQIGMKIMNSVGGSSGVLYGSAYIGAAKICKDIDVLDRVLLCDVLDSMTAAMMKRGDSKPGQKTMIDAIYPAVQAYRQALENNLPDGELLSNVKQASINGANGTKDLEAVRGRACYQANKGVGHLDPGAVTMSYQIETLMEYIQSII